MAPKKSSNMPGWAAQQLQVHLLQAFGRTGAHVHLAEHWKAFSKSASSSLPAEYESQTDTEIRLQVFCSTHFHCLVPFVGEDHAKALRDCNGKLSAVPHAVTKALEASEFMKMMFQNMGAKGLPTMSEDLVTDELKA